MLKVILLSMLCSAFFVGTMYVELSGGHNGLAFFCGVLTILALHAVIDLSQQDGDET